MKTQSKPSVLLFEGNNIDRLKEIDVKADICITSPPCYQQFDCELKGQHGHEDTVDLYIETLVTVFREVKRLLVEGGTCFIVIGDTLNNYSPVRAKHQRKSSNGEWKFRRKLQAGCREKEVLNVP